MTILVTGLVTPLSSEILYLSAVSLLVMTVAHLIVLFTRLGAAAGIGLAIVHTTVLMVMASQGGPRSPILVVMPGIPLVVSLLFGKFFGWIFCGYISTYVIASYFLQWGSTAPDILGATANRTGEKLSTIWIVHGTLFSAFFANYFHDKSARLNNALKDHAYLDYLTELPNRRAVGDRLRRETAMVKRTNSWLSVVMLDLDRFKEYNDKYGHALGDSCLRSVAKTLKEELKRSGDFIGRYGGEEFIAILPDTDPKDACEVSERLRVAVESIASDNESVKEPVTITIGCHSIRGCHIGEIESLTSEADKALYEGKRSGKNCVIVYVDNASKSGIDPSVSSAADSSVVPIEQGQLRRRGDK